jgi:hypothetical protein
VARVASDSVGWRMAVAGMVRVEMVAEMISGEANVTCCPPKAA